MRCILLSLLLFLISCTPDPVKINLAGNHWLGYQPLFIGYEQAQQQESLPFTLHRLPSTTNVLRLMAEGWLDGGFLTIDEALLYQAKTQDALCVLMVTNISMGGDAVIMVPEWRERTGTLKIAHEPTAVGRYMLQRARDFRAFGEFNIEPVVAAANLHTELFKKGSVDGLVTYYPSLREIKDLKGEVIFDSRAIPDEIIDVVVLKTALWGAHGQALQSNLLRLWDNTLDDFLNLTPPIVATVSQHTGLNRKQILQTFEGIVLSGAYLSKQLDLAAVVARVNHHLHYHDSIVNEPSLPFCQAVSTP